MYRFVGKKGQMYKFDVNEILIKLNYKCPKNPDGTFNCNLPEKDKQDTKKLKSGNKKSKEFLSNTNPVNNTTLDRNSILNKIENGIKLTNEEKEFLTGKKTVQTVGKISNKTPKPIISNAKNVISKVKKEASIGKVMPSTISELKSVVSELKTISKAADKKFEPNVPSPENFIKSNQYKNLCKTTNKLLSSKSNKQIVEHYVDDSSTINEFLIKGSILAVPSKQKAMEDIAKHAISGLDKIMNKSKLPEPITTYSGISKEFYDKISKNGTNFISPAFISTSADQKVAEGFTEVRGIEELNTTGMFDNVLENPKNLPKEGYMLEIKLPAGTKALTLNDFVLSSNKLNNTLNPVGEGGKLMSSGSQHEILLDRGMTFRVVGRETITSEYKHENGKGNTFPIKKLIIEVLPPLSKESK